MAGLSRAFASMAALLIVTAFGVLAARLGYLNASNRSGMSKLILNVTMPCIWLMSTFSWKRQNELDEATAYLLTETGSNRVIGDLLDSVQRATDISNHFHASISQEKRIALALARLALHNRRKRGGRCRRGGTYALASAAATGELAIATAGPNYLLPIFFSI